MSIIVPRCGFNCNTRKAILYGPLAFGGANFRSLYVQQGVAQVLMFVRHWRKTSITCKLLRISVSWFQAQVGVSFSILEHVHSPVPHLESKWLSSLRLFLQRINAKLRLDTQYLPALQRLHDACIMDVIQSAGIFSNSEICKINYCRLYLNVVTVSDLTTINGRQLDMNKLSGTHNLLSSRTYSTAIIKNDLRSPRGSCGRKQTRYGADRMVPSFSRWVTGFFLCIRCASVTQHIGFAVGYGSTSKASTLNATPSPTAYFANQTGRASGSHSHRRQSRC